MLIYEYCKKVYAPVVLSLVHFDTVTVNGPEMKSSKIDFISTFRLTKVSLVILKNVWQIKKYPVHSFIRQLTLIDLSSYLNEAS